MSTVLSIDVMGGDKGPLACLEAIRAFSKKNPKVKFIVHGCGDDMEKAIKESDKEFMDFRFSTSSIKVGEKKTSMLAMAEGSSLMNAIQSVKDGEAHGVMSMGDTGAIALLSCLVFGRIKGVSKCALIAYVPTLLFGHMIILDVGSNLERSAECLISNSIIGGLAHGALLGGAILGKKDEGLSHTKVALLNVGSEEHKGGDALYQANKVLNGLQNEGNLPFKYVGFREPQEVFKGDVDVIVADGFSGNLMIKSLEAGYWFCRNAIKNDFASSGLIKKFFLGFMRSYLRKSTQQISPKNFNGALFAGVKGVVVKSHGYSNVNAIVRGMEITLKFVNYSIVEEITERIQLVESMGKK